MSYFYVFSCIVLISSVNCDKQVSLVVETFILTSHFLTVVYHDGKEATKGHYVTEVQHSGTGSWLRFDDSIVRVVETQPFKYNLPRMPYLLLYRKLNV